MNPQVKYLILNILPLEDTSVWRLMNRKLSSLIVKATEEQNVGQVTTTAEF
jgi:hypothetical protein